MRRLSLCAAVSAIDSVHVLGPPHGITTTDPNCDGGSRTVGNPVKPTQGQIMSTAKLLLVAYTAACALSAAASEADAWQNIPQARSTQSVAPNDVGRTRADVRAEFLPSRAESAAMRGEDSGSVFLALVADRTRLAGTAVRAS
jgi:hypothetical protein